jgi:pimeloyl-ACP methyl ester carboxylesterase
MELSVDGRRVFGHTGGRPFEPHGPVLLLLHGAGCDHTMWGMQTRWFAHHGFAVLALDLPGHGRSEGAPPATIDDYAAWLWRAAAAAGVPETAKVALAGHSMGSLIALAAAGAAPQRVAALSLLGASAHMQVHPDLVAAAEANDASAFAAITDWGYGRAAHIGGHQAPGLWFGGGSRALLATSRAGVLAAGLVACDAYTGGPHAAARITCPTQFLVGAGDRMTPPRSIRPLVAALDAAGIAARVDTLPDTGHMIMVERPNETIDLLADFLQPVMAAAA